MIGQRLSASLYIATLGLVAMSASQALSMCDSIPLAHIEYASDRASINRSLAAWGDMVSVRLPGCLCQDAGKCDLTAGTLGVYLKFDHGGRRIRLATTNISKRSVDIELPTPTGNRRAAGPAKIQIEVGGKTVAQIHDLGQPSSGCSSKSNSIVKRFTVLPEANEAKGSSNPAQELLATFDHDQNLLIPLKHISPPVLGSGTPVANHVRGSGGWNRFRAALVEAKLSGDLELRALTIEGRPLPPVVVVDDIGNIFGSADPNGRELRSVLRLSMPPNTQGRKIWNRLNKKMTTKGVVTVDKKNRPFRFQICKSILPDGTRVSQGLAAFTVDQRLEDDDPATNDRLVSLASFPGSFCEAPIQKPAVQADDRTVLGASAGYAAFLEDSAGDQILRVYSRAGHEMTKGDWTAGINGNSNILAGESLVVEEPLVYFLDGNGNSKDVLSVFDVDSPVTRKLQKRVKAASAAGRFAAYVEHATNRAHIWFRGAANAIDLGVTARDGLALDEKLLAFASPRQGASKLHYLPLPANGTPDASSLVSTPYHVTQVAVVGKIIVFSRSEQRSGQDWNGDNDRSDNVLFSLDTTSNQLVNTRHAVTDFVVGGEYVAFRTLESDQGSGSPAVTNGDGDQDDHIVSVNHIMTPRVDTTAGSGTIVPFAGWNWVYPYAIRGELLFFFQKEVEEGDQNGNGIMETLLRVFHIPSTSFYFDTLTAARGNVTSVPLQIRDLGAGAYFEVSTAEGMSSPGALIAGDYDSDGVFDPFDSCVSDPNPHQIDLDCDGLGESSRGLRETGCDPSVCRNFQPSVELVTTAQCRNSLSDIGRKYLVDRLKITRRCLERDPDPDGETGENRESCYGDTVGGREVLPRDSQTRRELEILRRGFVEQLLEPDDARDCPTPSSTRVEKVARIYAEAIDAAVWSGYGVGLRGSVGDEAEKCQLAVGDTIAFLPNMLSASTECFGRSNSNSCLPHIAENGASLPRGWGRDVNAMWQVHRQAIKESCSTAGTLESLDACSTDPEGLAQCLLCVMSFRTHEAIVGLDLVGAEKGAAAATLACEAPAMMSPAFPESL